MLCYHFRCRVRHFTRSHMHLDLLHIRGRHIFLFFRLNSPCSFARFDLIYISVLAESYSYTNVAFLVHTYKSRTTCTIIAGWHLPYCSSLPLDLPFSSHPWPRIHYNFTPLHIYWPHIYTSTHIKKIFHPLGGSQILLVRASFGCPMIPPPPFQSLSVSLRSVQWCNRGYVTVLLAFASVWELSVRAGETI